MDALGGDGNNNNNSEGSFRQIENHVLKLDIKIREQCFASPALLKETQSVLIATLQESSSAYKCFAMDCEKRVGQKLFLDAEYDAFLMRFWRNSVLNVHLRQSGRNILHVCFM